MVEFIGWVLRGEQSHIKVLRNDTIELLKQDQTQQAKENMRALHDEIFGDHNKRKVITANSIASRNSLKSINILENIRM
ncbi:hypothetical protein HOC01_02390 [archaeon]|jgi:hypothetical protein|nr:hypothetical protein [archaeon]MBT6697833.1 hypothetical protein [archaeon]